MMKLNLIFIRTSTKMNFMTMSLQPMKIVSATGTCVSYEESLEETVNYGTNACGALSVHIRNLVAGIHLKAIFVHIQRERETSE
jgi:hypothetical protein